MSDTDLEVFSNVSIPSNVSTATKLDPFMKALLERKGMQKVISMDEELQKLHNKLYSVMGPLGKVWKDTQDFLQNEDDEDEEKNLDPHEVVDLFSTLRLYYLDNP